MVHTLQFYKCAADILKLAIEDGKNVKQLLYSEKRYQFLNIKSLYALVSEALKHWDVLEILINESKILIEESWLNVWHLRILVTELLFGKQAIASETKPGNAILQYHDKFKELMSEKRVQKLLTPSNTNLDNNKVRYVKVNTLSVDVETVISNLTDEGWQQLKTEDSYQSYLNQLRELEPCSQLFLQDFHIPEVLVFPHGTELYKHDLYKNGSIYFMDKSSCLAPYLLQPHAHSTVLDMCAAPGLKTIHLAAIVKSGKVYAVERDAKRFKLLEEMVRSSGANNVVSIHEDVTKLQPNKFSDVEYILLDPSCSGSGMRERQPGLGPGIHDEGIRLYKLAGFQLTLLRFALTRFPAAKRVVYSTCSLNVEENEEIVKAALYSKFHNFELVSAGKILPEWINFGSSDFEFGQKCIYARPETDLTNGFFVAVFERRKDDLSTHESTREAQNAMFGEDELANRSDFVEKNKTEAEFSLKKEEERKREFKPDNKYKEMNGNKVSKKRPYVEVDHYDTKKGISSHKRFKEDGPEDNTVSGEEVMIKRHLSEKNSTKSNIKLINSKNDQSVVKVMTNSLKKRIRQRKAKNVLLISGKVNKKNKQEKKIVEGSKAKKRKSQCDKSRNTDEKKDDKSANLKLSKAKIRRLRLQKIKKMLKKEKSSNLEANNIKAKTPKILKEKQKSNSDEKKLTVKHNRKIKHTSPSNK